MPTALVVLFGNGLVRNVLSVVPSWVTDGLSIAGSMLPVVGIAMLLQVMPAKKYLSMLMVGFVLSAYLKMPMMGVSIVGFAMACYFFVTTIKKNSVQTSTDVDTVETDEEGYDWDE
ncbi:mannose/fructose/sorbose-specific PTS system IIC component [Ligilactobacillus acidipiscis]|nr:mannose/fructose/sorbose-specific PTS system IIC component [Ligilactobacillus acidipiscis]GEN21871.1 hypothetical protein LAC02_51520 [Ligilactobacillus acidipiscis]